MKHQTNVRNMLVKTHRCGLQFIEERLAYHSSLPHIFFYKNGLNFITQPLIMKIINVLILFDLIYFVKSDTCNENWVLIEEKCVKFSSEKLTYHEAVEHCTNAGMYNNFILFFT